MAAETYGHEFILELLEASETVDRMLEEHLSRVRQEAREDDDGDVVE